MTRRGRAASRVLPLCLLLFPAAARAQPEGPGPGEGPEVSIEIYRNDTLMTSPFDVSIRLTNLQNRTYRIQRIRVRVPDAILATRTLETELVDDDAPTTIDPHSHRFYELQVGRAELTLLESLFDLHTFLFVPGEYPIAVVVDYRNLDGVGGSIRRTRNLELRPPLSSLLRGGVLGSALLALFAPLYRVARGQPAPRAGRLVGAVVVFGSGGVVAVITVLLLQRLGDLDLPLTLDVKDWIGATIVGLFSYQIGDVLYGRFFPTSDRATKEP